MKGRYYGIGILAALAIALLILLGMFKTAEAPADVAPSSGSAFVPIEASEPTDFIQLGNLSFDAPGNRQDTPYLVYDEPGAPGRSVELVMDPLSFCATETGSLQCIAMSASYSIPFGGKRALVDGTRQADGSVLVRTMRIVSDERIELNTGVGRRYISWPAAESAIRTCAVGSLMQAHSLDVRIQLHGGEEYYTVEPMIDFVLNAVRDAEGRCGPVRVSTE